MVGDNLLKDIQGAQDAGLEYQRKTPGVVLGTRVGLEVVQGVVFLSGWIDPEMGRPFFFGEIRFDRNVCKGKLVKGFPRKIDENSALFSS